MWSLKYNLLSTVTPRNLNLSIRAISWFLIRTAGALRIFLFEIKDQADLLAFSNRRFALSHASTFESYMVCHSDEVINDFTFRICCTVISKVYKV